MIIKKIRLRRFKRFNALNAELSSGLNVIKGPNEAGKSSMHAALVAGLFFNPSHRRKEIRRNLSWGSDEMYRIGLDIEVDNTGYTLNKDFQVKRLSLKGNGLTEEIVDFAKLTKKMDDWLGFSSANAYRSTACIEQDKVARISKGEREIGDNLQETITGGDEVTASWALSRLREAIKSLTKGLGRTTKYPGEIQKTRLTIEQLREKQEQVKIEEEKIRAAKEKLVFSKKELAEVRAKLATKQKLKEKNERRLKLREELDDIDIRLEEIQRAFDIKKEIDTCERKLRPFRSLSKIKDDDFDAFHILLGQKKSFLKTKETLQKQLLPPFLEVAAENKAPFNYFLIGGAVLLGIGIAGAFFNRLMLLVAFAGLILAGYGVWRMKSETAVDPGIMRAQVEKQIDQAKEQLTQLDNNIEYFLSKAGCENAEEFLKKYDKYKPLQSTKTEKENKLKGILGRGTLENFEKESKMLILERKARLEEWEDLELIALAPEEFVRLSEEIEDFSEKESLLRDEVKEAGIILSQIGATDEESAFLQEEIANLEARLTFYERRQRTYEMTLEMMEKARKATLRSATKVLEEEIAHYISRITNGRYQKVTVDEESLNFSVYSPEKADYVKAEDLSRATIDQIYLAARLGLVELIAKDKKPPLLFDDPFVTFDSKRLATTMNLVKEMAKQYQILFFTCSDRYDTYADRVIDLSLQ